MKTRHRAATRPFYDGCGVTLYAGDAGDVLTTLPAASVHSVVTSPPYWGLRDYGTGHWIGGNRTCRHTTGPARQPQPKNPAAPYPALTARGGRGPRRCRRCQAVREDRQYGHEDTPSEYVNTVRAVFTQLHRVLVGDGTVWLNLGDSYSTTPTGNTGLPAKNLIGLPWQIALALQADGWIIRNAIVWHKPNAMPESVQDRLTTRHELVFLLVKQRVYYFDLDAIREPPAHPDALGKGTVIGGTNKGHHAAFAPRAHRRGRNTHGKYTATEPFHRQPLGAAMRPGRPHNAAHPRGKNPGDVWSMPTRPLRAAHFAAFPIDLPLRCIAAGCPPGGVVLDPFSGAATTGLAARQLGRSYIGIDLNPAFHTIALQRLGLTRHKAPHRNDRADDRHGV